MKGLQWCALLDGEPSIKMSQSFAISIHRLHPLLIQDGQMTTNFFEDAVEQFKLEGKGSKLDRKFMF
jgi:hypothetical protein